MKRWSLVLALSMSSCLPSYLAKYDRHNNVASTPAARPQQPANSIFALGEQTYRFSLRDDEVWDSALNVLLRNYNLNIVDHSSGIITTEWDSFYLHQGVYRNKISMRLRRVGYGSVDVIIHNSVERLQDGATAGTVGAVWLPAADSEHEAQRIVQNMALYLNQPPPVLGQTGQVARAADTAETPQSR